jgi:peptidoglycan-N-acetylglucosamine deacetylase
MTADVGPRSSVEQVAMVEAGLLFLIAVMLAAAGSRLWGMLPWRVAIRWRFALLAPVASALVLAATYQVMNARSFQVVGELVHRVDTREAVIALTFDDGPTLAHTDEIRALLRDEGVRATYFVTGDALAVHPELGAALVADGHELGNHSFSHRRLLFTPFKVIRWEVEETDRLIRQAGSTGPIHFRSPYGKKLLLLPLYLWQTDRTNILWDVEPDSDPSATAEQMVSEVARNARPGSIILLHGMDPTRKETRGAVPGIIAALREQGYRFVTISELLALRQDRSSARTGTQWP